ncbi:MAG: 50S ribosomal protein L28 [Candidatus Marinimicrobia bacterium]|jgi:large subunit ribosomal protein L28|nr:50S ribosomal protein L28 [Candidatus Neomarinimicrobiota bacterium]MAW74661.1 50S ribosomal protein L28 [Candidatus Neomarinimicrobiota bacterium]|tara:strand:- start:224 stop:463 length:240 start_codon:yes stop_codon:yes gene_type:complete
MSRVCQVTGKRALVGNNVSKSNVKTKRKQFPNLQTRRLYVPELDKKIKVKLSTSALKTIDKIGLMTYLKKQNLKLSDIS